MRNNARWPHYQLVGTDSERAWQAIERFLTKAAEPQVIEPGDQPIPLNPDNRIIELVADRLTLQAWTEERNLVRRVTAVLEEAPGCLQLATERFGKRSGVLQLIDRAVPRNIKNTRRAARLTGAEQLRRSLTRQFAGWRINEVSCEPDLQHSLSPAYPRAFLHRGGTGWAAIAAAADAGSVDGVLTFGLIWLDYLRRRERRITVEGLAVFVSAGQERTTCLRIRSLHPRSAQFAVFVTDERWEQRVDLADAGNLETRLQPRHSSYAPAEWMRRLAEIDGVEAVEQSDGATSWRARGLEFARYDGSQFRLGLQSLRVAAETQLAEVEALGRELVRMRSPDAVDRSGALYSSCPERWLESQIRARISDLDPALLDTPVYGQVPAFAGTDRGVLDLLACGLDGRLTVVEVKASEDVHLPLQALDYWMRVDWHARRGEFASNGYFPGNILQPSSPRLLLVAPALQFHSTTATILRYFPPEIEVERIGVGAAWRHELKVVSRTSRQGSIS